MAANAGSTVACRAKSEPEAHVKRIAVASAALLILALPLSAAERNNIVDEVIKMWKANVAEETILQFVQKSDARFSVTADDVIDMADAKVPRTIIKAVLDEADARGDRSRRDDRADRGSTYYRPRVYVGSYWGWDPWYYDPWYSGWYGYRPGFSIGIGFGPRYYYPRHFRRWR